VAKTLRFPKRPKPQQSALRATLLQGLVTIGYGLEEGSYRPTLLETSLLGKFRVFQYATKQLNSLYAI
jgi:hypothetical protein